MKTQQIMKRDFNGNPISQRTTDRFFNATELLAVYNTKASTQKRFKDFWENKNTKEFLQELENDFFLNGDNSAHSKTHETSRGGGGATWMHPYLFVKFAMWLSPKFELQIIKWVYDNLIDLRVDAGDYYKELMTAVYEWHLRNKENVSPLIYSNEATMLNLLVYNSPKAKQRNYSKDIELALLNELQVYDILLLEENLTISERKKKLSERKAIFEKMNAKKYLYNQKNQTV